MIENKSLVKNATLNVVKTVCSIMFPLITFPYVSRVLQVENLGAYNFATSIISYVSLFAGLGIGTYAVREGARCRGDKQEISKFASELFTINVFSTIIAYLFFFGVLFTVPKLQNYRTILMVLSVSVFFQTIGCEWIFNIFEEFGYITLRTIIFQVVSLILLFVFVRSSDGLLAYSVITVVASSGTNLINLFARQKYCKVQLIFNKESISRIVPILILFANTLATNIYINLDMTMLGALSGDYYTGLYSVSTKIYFILKNLLSAVIIVSIPRLSSYLGNENTEKYTETANNILNALLLLVVPIVVGVNAIADNIIMIIAGAAYNEAASSLRLLSFALFFCLFGWFYTSCVLIPYKRDKKVLLATVSAAGSNILLNMVLIPIWFHNAAAFTTVIAEFVSFIICFLAGRKYFQAMLSKNDIVTMVLGNVAIYTICKVVTIGDFSVTMSIIVSVCTSIIVYYLILKVGKNKSIKYVEDMVLSRLRKNK